MVQGHFRPTFIVVSGDLFCSVIILCFFWCAIIWQFSKNTFLEKWVQKLGFSIFCLLSLNFEDYLLLQKHYKNRGFSYCLCLSLLKEKKIGKNMTTGISGFVFLSKSGRFVTQISFSKNTLLKPLFYSVLGVRACLAKLSKRRNFGHPPKRLIDN